MLHLLDNIKLLPEDCILHDVFIKSNTIILNMVIFISIYFISMISFNRDINTRSYNNSIIQ